MRLRQEKVLMALKHALIPLMRLLMRYNIDLRQFIEVSKHAFIEAARSEYGIRDRPTNDSRVAGMSGMTRKEVRRVRTLLANNDGLREAPRPMSQSLIDAWQKDRDFRDPDGKPKELPVLGRGSSFGELVRRYGGDRPPGAIRKEMLRAGVIKEGQDGILRVTRKELLSRSDAARVCQAIKRIESSLEEIETDERN